MNKDIPKKLVIIEEISNDGHYSTVILCENSFLNRRKEAVKIIKTNSAEEQDIVQELKENLFESSVLEYLRKSKYIVEIYDAEVLEKGFRINMEYLVNGSVQKLLNSSNVISPRKALKIFECVLHALEFAHLKGILHLDIKPGNILIKNDNIYKLSDFGLSNIKRDDGTSSFKDIYSLNFPPELLLQNNSKATEQSDIYMFGVTAYRILNGNSHFANQINSLSSKKEMFEAIQIGKFPNRKKYSPHVNIRFKKIINKCLSINLNKRYKNIRDVRNDIAKINPIYDWILLKKDDEKQHWECDFNEKLYLEIIVNINIKGQWDLNLLKYGKTKKTKVSKHCFNNLTEVNLNKKLRNIFTEYF